MVARVASFSKWFPTVSWGRSWVRRKRQEMTNWSALEAELDAWESQGRVATFWWRDDDACEPAPALEQLVQLASERRLPLALAVIPALANRSLAEFLAAWPNVSVLQHGYAHKNHAGPTEEAIELGPHRPLDQVIVELADGWQRLVSLFREKEGGRALLPVVVPPYNRIEPRLIPMLPGAGFTGLSGWGPRPGAAPTRGLQIVNTHVDLMNWNDRSFLGRGPVLDAAVTHLRNRRTGRVDAEEPTGFLTHHLVHDRDIWNFIAEFLDRTGAHPAAGWLSAAELFARNGPRI